MGSANWWKIWFFSAIVTVQRYTVISLSKHTQALCLLLGWHSTALHCTAPLSPTKWQKITKECGRPDKVDSLHSPSQMCLPFSNHWRIYAVAGVLKQCFICTTWAVLQQFTFKRVSGRQCPKGMPPIFSKFNYISTYCILFIMTG